MCSVSPDETMNLKASRSPAPREHQLDLGAQRARRDAERIRRAEAAHARRRLRVEHVAARDQLLEVPGFLVDQHLDLLVAEEELVVHRDLLEHPLVVVAEVFRAVGGLIEVNAVRLEQLLVDPQVQRLGVGEDAVEVEDYRSQVHSL